MSTWNLGISDVSEETQAFKDRLSSKDSQISAQQTQLMRKAAELEELQSTLHDALHKLSHETNRVLQLEKDLNGRSDELRNEKIAVQNVGQALATAQERIRAKDLEARDLEAHLQALSHTSDDHNARGAKLEREKHMLEVRVRELEANIQQLSYPPTTPGRTRAARPRSSSVSNFRIPGLEQELNDTRSTLLQKDADLKLANQKLTQAQNDLIKTSNERLATEKKMTKQVAELQASVEEKDDELHHLKQESNGSREEELLKRIEEDEAKIMALETLLRSEQDAGHLKDKLRRTEEKLKEEGKRVFESEERHIELIREKEEALDELEYARMEISKFSRSLAERENYIKTLTTQEQQTDTDLGTLDLMNITTDHPLPASTLRVQPMGLDTSSVERLLNAVERVRGERDTLQRNITFLEYESKFTIEALEAKLATSASAISKITQTSSETIERLKSEVEVLGIRHTEMTRRGVATVQEKDQRIRRLSQTALAFAIVMNHLHSKGSLLEQRLFDAHAFREEMEDRLMQVGVEEEELVQKLKECETKLDVTVMCLETMTSHRDDLVVQLDAKDEERESDISNLKNSLQEARGDLEGANMQLADVSNSLQEVESERDSLALQITNLMADLQTAQDDLARAESRYSSLQFHQLSSMSSNEATRALQDQIEELEMRVMRRTEQIGIHQHDIKRLETNLRLSEEHIDELTMDLETATTQKNAMVEDCADARETRDEALARLDQMEADIEINNDERDTAVLTLVGLVMETVGTSRVTAKHLKTTAQLAKEKLHRVEIAHRDALLELGKIPTLESQLSSYQEEAIRLTLALAASQVQLHHNSTSLNHLRSTNEDLSREAQRRQNELDKMYVESTSLQEQLDTLQHEASSEASNFIAMKSELEAQICSLQASVTNIEAAHRVVTTELESSRDYRDVMNGALEGEVVALKQKHAGELSDMQTRLAEMSSTVEALQKRHEAAEADYQRDLSDAMQSKQDVETRLAEASELLTHISQEKQRSELSQKETTNENLRLKCDLEAALADAVAAQRLRNETEELYQRLSDELAHLRLGQNSQTFKLTEESRVRKQLEEELADLQCKYDSQFLRLEQATQEVDRLTRELQSQDSDHSKDKQTLEKRLHLLDEQCCRAESSLAVLSQELKVVRSQLQQSEQEFEALQGEKVSLQEEITSLEAEIQRSISLSRFLESQVKESESRVVSITVELEKTQADLACSEKAAKAAEVNLSLQGAQHKREMSDVQRDLTTLKSQPNLQLALAELEERNNEMEELLRAKCTEIEENDDRALEMLKDNKKLSTKVESLSRKVQNLQTKLAAAKASIPNPTPKIVDSSPLTVTSKSSYVSRPESDMLTDTPPLPLPPIPAYAPSSATRAPLNRAVSGPPSLSRPKTPERKSAPPPVFKARTPERRAVSMVPSEATSSTTIGKKRRAPDDFEACESVPPQGFTADSLPSTETEHITPRVRRVLTNIQSGFTPVRNNTRPVMPIPSPKRLATTSRSSPLISDVTNSPRQSAKSSKRSWLGKIRGVSTQTTGRIGDARPRFERTGDTS